MVKKNYSKRKNSLGFNTLNVSLFILLVFSLFFIGAYLYTTSVPNISQLKGALASVSPETYPQYACINDDDCRLQPFDAQGTGMNEECAAMKCQEKGADTKICAPVSGPSGIFCNNENGRCNEGKCISL